MDPLLSLISSTNWIFVLVATVVSMIIGMLWFGNHMFGPTYARWIKLPPMPAKGSPEEKECNQSMGKVMVLEFISRALYFTGIGWAFMVAPQESIVNWICLAAILWLAFAFSTQVSAVIRSNADWRALWIVGSKMLLDSVIAVLLWTMVF